jgi:hypothetical protein
MSLMMPKKKTSVKGLGLKKFSLLLPWITIDLDTLA